MKTRYKAAMLAALCCCGYAAAAHRADRDASRGPLPTPEKPSNSGIVAVGYRAFSTPFASRTLPDEPIGYSIDLCRAVVTAMGKKVGGELAIDWVLVTSASRVDDVVKGKVDLECGSTTNNAERSEHVAFSPPIHVAATKLLVRKGAFLHFTDDLAGKRIAVTKGTTTVQVMRALSEKYDLRMELVFSDDHAESFSKVVSGEAEAFANDDVLLSGLIAQKGVEADYEVLSDRLSEEPYGIMFRRDDGAMAALVDATFDALKQNGEWARLKQRWLQSPVSAERQSVLAVLGAIDRILNAALTDDQFDIFAWGTALLAIALLLGAGLYGRSTPFVLPTLHLDRRAMLAPRTWMTCGILASFCLLTWFALNSAADAFGYSPPVFLLIQLLAGACFALGIPLSAALAKLWSRRLTMMVVSVSIVIFGLLMASIIRPAHPVQAVLFPSFGMGLMGMTWRPIARLRSELFPATFHHSGPSSLVDVAGSFAASIIPYGAIWLASYFALSYIGYSLSSAALVTFFALLIAGELARIRAERHEREIETKSDELRKADVEKTEILERASHDLKAFLEAIGILGEALEKHSTPPEIKAIADQIQASVEDRVHYFKKLLDISKTDVGKVIPEIVEFRVAKLLDAMSLYVPMAERKGLELKMVSSSAVIRSDPDLLWRALMNLVSNAITYTNTGKVLVGCRRRGAELEIQVLDTGIGIPKEETEHIFEKFVQLSSPSHERSKGSGLGLDIVRAVAKLLGHRKAVHSTLGKGSAFSISVPLIPRAALSADASQLANAFVVVIDDDAHVLSRMKVLLTRAGCHVVCAQSAGEAIEALADHQRDPELIVSDYVLADGQIGLDAIQQLREARNANIPAVILTRVEGTLRTKLNEEGAARGHRILSKALSDSELLRSLGAALRCPSTDPRDPD